METNYEGFTMAEWLREVDAVILKIVGLTHEDLADFPIYDLWSDGTSPTDAAYECLVEWNDMDPGLFEEMLNG